MSRLQERRKAAGMNQAKLAEAAGVNVRMLQYYEQGAKDINRAEAMTVYKLAKTLNCTVEDLLEI